MGTWKSIHELMEQDYLNVSFAMYGNPKPDVTVTLGEDTLDIVSTAGSNPFTYNYTAKLQNANRNQCGKNMAFKAVGYTNMTFLTKINVSCKYTTVHLFVNDC